MNRSDRFEAFKALGFNGSDSYWLVWGASHWVSYYNVEASNTWDTVL